MNARATRFPLFDSLRAIAALAIFGTHAAIYLGVGGGALRPYAARLDVGVYIFFVISGFLLYRPFVRARLGDRAAPSAVAYGWRRLLRIAPAYWVALTICALWLGQHYVFEPQNAAWYYLIGQSYQPTLAIGGLTQAWSLTVEVAFYVFLPLYALGMRSLPVGEPEARFRSELWGLALLAVLGLACTTLAARTGIAGGRLQLTLPSFLHVFAAGMLLAVLSVRYQERDLPSWIRPLDRFPGLAWAVALVAFLVVSKVGADAPSGQHTTTAHWVSRSSLYVVIGLAVVTPAVFGDQTRGLVRRVLANRVLLWIGLVSYSLFLYHRAVTSQVDKWGLGSAPIAWVVALTLSLAVSAVSYYLVERPAISLKGWVKARPEPPPTEAIEEPAPSAPARVG